MLVLLFTISLNEIKAQNESSLSTMKQLIDMNFKFATKQYKDWYL